MPLSAVQAELLEQLLHLPLGPLDVTLSRAADLVARALGADKVDTFVHDPARETLVALGSSTQPLSQLQRKLGLDVLPLANAGRAVQVFLTGESWRDGHVDRDAEELRGIREALGVRSSLGVPLEVGPTRRGVLLVTSQRPERWGPEHVRFLELVARWIGVVAHRAELVEEIAGNAVEQGRRAVAEELITVLAHDLRNLLWPIDTRLEALRRRAEGGERADEARALEGVLASLRRLAEFLDDMLDVTRLDHGLLQVEVRRVELVTLVEDVARLLSPPEQRIEVRAAEPVFVAGDRARLQQCLQNLLTNAVQHSPRGGQVTVEVSESGGRARVEVIDEGPGIPPAQLARVFERFVTNRQGGFGLGLYVARRIAHLHHGDLVVASPVGRGARFLLTLPTAEAEAGSAPAAGERALEPRPGRAA